MDAPKRILAAGLLAALSPLSPLLAGGGEVFCSGGNTVIEAWRNIPAEGLDWTLNYGPNGTRFAPEYEVVGCIAQAFPAAPLEDFPGAQSLVRAARTWEGATDPSTGAAMTSIRFNPIPSYLAWQYLQPGFFVPAYLQQADGMNMLTLWEPEWTYSFLGGPGVVAIALVDVNTTTGDILEADIGFQALSKDGDDRPYWSFVEENALTGRTNASTTANLFATPWEDPVFGYVDLEGIAVHELGHFLGLGHTLVEGPASNLAGTCPSMFQTGHTEGFAGTVHYQDPNTGSCGNLLTAPIDASNAPVGGLLGRNARDLQADDRSAIGALYPSADFATQLGTIRGQVLDSNGVGLAGVHVLALSVERPNFVRVGALALDDGQYELPGLPPGDFFVLVESVDKGGFFDPATLPNYVDSSSSSCVPNVPAIQAEAWDTGEDWFGEAAPMAASAVTVTAGGITTGIDLKVLSQGFADDVLRVRDVTAPVSSASSRGIRLAPAPGVDPTIELRVDEDPSLEGQTVYLSLVPERKNLVFNGELSQLSDQSSIPGFPVIVTQTLDAAGDATFTFNVGNGLAHLGLACQAYAVRPNYTLKISNTVSVFVDQP